MLSSNSLAEQSASTLANLVARASANREKILRWAWVVQLFVALMFLGFAWHTGKDRARLIYSGARTQGTVVAYQQVYFRDSRQLSSGRNSYRPVVEFQASDHNVRFKDMIGTRVAGPTRAQVTVLYDAANPNVAMIDRGRTNWLPWAPPLAIGAFLAIVALVGFLRGTCAPG